MNRSLADWLRWQESLNPREIDLGLDRVRQVARRLPIDPPAGAVFTVAGTNGKGTTINYVAHLLRAGGYCTGVYTSPHLVRYNERVCIAGKPVDDGALIDAFERIEVSRDGVPLTFFEFGTLAALLIFSAADCDAWVLEVGLGGRLDAVNLIDPAFSLITTIALDHQDWLGNSVEEIAAEKAGIMRAGVPAYYGDEPAPEAISAHAAGLDTPLYRFGRDFGAERGPATWSWRGLDSRVDELRYPRVGDAAQLRNMSLAMAALERFDARLLTPARCNSLVDVGDPAGRFQIIAGQPQWILDVAHNQQAARVLRGRLDALDDPRDTTAVVGILADKQLDEFVAALSDVVDRWVVAELEGPRAADSEHIAQRIGRLTGRPAEFAGRPVTAFDRAVELTSAAGRIICCGSFRIVGPAIEWLGLYS